MGIDMAQSKVLYLADILEATHYYEDLHEAVAAELRRLHHNNQVLTNALWKACGDDEGVVNDTIASEGELK
jgi:hypothetical protein